MTNREVVAALAREAECDRRTAWRALEHGSGPIRTAAVRDRVAFAMRRIKDVVKQYRKEHYP